MSTKPKGLVLAYKFLFEDDKHDLAFRDHEIRVVESYIHLLINDQGEMHC